MKHLLILLSILLLFTFPLYGQSKPLGVVLPPTVMGNVSDSRKQILLNTLDEEVSKYFDVSPPPQIESGDLPVVSDVFQLQILEEDGDTQLTLRWMSGNERKVETKLCGGCKTIELNGNLKELVGKLFGGKKVEQVRVVGKRGKRVLFFRKGNSGFGWFEDGDEKKDEKYVGEIENGEPNGQGTEISPDGRKYVGEFKGDQKNGQGTYTQPDGYKYVGEWKDGQRNGQGTETYSDGEKYVGEWKDGQRNGQGTYTWSVGSKYVGEWKNGKKHGQGTFTHSDGEVFIGEFKDGYKNGQGTYTRPNGTKGIGKFRNDRPWNITEYYKNGNINGKFVNGEWIKN